MDQCKEMLRPDKTDYISITKYYCKYHKGSRKQVVFIEMEEFFWMPISNHKYKNWAITYAIMFGYIPFTQMAIGQRRGRQFFSLTKNLDLLKSFSWEDQQSAKRYKQTKTETNKCEKARMKKRHRHSNFKFDFCVRANRRIRKKIIQVVKTIGRGRGWSRNQRRSQVSGCLI